MKKLFLTAVIFLSFVMSLAQADETRPPYPRLNEIYFTVSAEQWVSTDTAKVIIGVDANLDTSGLDKLQTTFLANLNKLSKDGQWRITQFYRSQSQSELETVHIEAEARLPQNQLSNIRTNAKEMSKPGMKYSVIDIQYSPSVIEIEKVRDQLRNELYLKIKNEMDRINKIYADQPYYLHMVNFGSGDMPPPQPAMMESARAKQMTVNAPAVDYAQGDNGYGGLGVSQKIVMTASVVVASTIVIPNK